MASLVTKISRLHRPSTVWFYSHRQLRPSAIVFSPLETPSLSSLSLVSAVRILPLSRFASSRDPAQRMDPPVSENNENPELAAEQDMMIYRGILSTQIKLVKTFSLLTSIIGLSCQPILLFRIQESSGSLTFVIASGAFMSFFTFATPLLIHWVSKKYVTELLYNKIDDTYTAVTYSLLLRKREIKFRVSDVKVPDIPGMFTTFKASGNALFVDGGTFQQPEHFGKIMGYDKPLNLRWKDGRTQSQADADQLSFSSWRENQMRSRKGKE